MAVSSAARPWARQDIYAWRFGWFKRAGVRSTDPSPSPGFVLNELLPIDDPLPQKQQPSTTLMALKQLNEEQVRTWTLEQKDRWWFEKSTTIK